MDYQYSDQNTLIQAIKQEDWPAVRNILEDKPHLIVTVDEYGHTPLMDAVENEAPESVLGYMINKASIENLEQQERVGGSTILHLLALYAPSVLAMKSVLEKTNKNINTQDNDGRTPLHYCLYDWWEPRSYEYHKDVALCLITYGASTTIENKNGRTPLDAYDGNECNGYEETTKNEKKVELKELIEKLSIPSEILARGPEAVKAFKDALKNGEITVVNSRMMFLGKEGSGKTCCINAMLGKGFNVNEPSTDGIVTTTVFQTVGEDYSKWEEKDVDECEQTKQILEHSIASDVAKMMEKPISNQISSDLGETSSSPVSVASTSAAVVEEPEAEMQSTFEIRKVIEKPLDTGVSTNQLILRKKVFENVLNKSSGPRDLTCIWDYAGQLEYYITHRFFLTDKTSYGVVFNLLDALDELAKRRDPKKGRLEMTNLQSLIFWIRSIFEHAVLLHGSEKTNVIHGKIASPPISLIGTHKDLLTGTDEEKETKIKDIFKRIFKEIEGKPYELHIDRFMYAVDNTTAHDEGIQRLKRNVGSYMKTMTRTVPIKWVEFQIKVQEIGKTTLRMSLDEITKLAVECGIKEDNVKHVLNYLNDLGIILYSPARLKNTVITNIHMLIGIFMRIITVVKPDDADKAPVMIQDWRKLDEEGILTEPLARHLWTNELTASKGDRDTDTILKDFIEIMKMFRLLFEKERKNKSEDGPRLFVVPSRLKTKTSDRLKIKEDEKQTISIYVTPKDFLPDYVYDILVVSFVNLSQDKGCCDDPKLFQNQSEIGFDERHYLKLGRISIDNKHSLKIEISRKREKDEHGEDKLSCKPHPIVCMEVLHVLRQHLDEVYPSKKVVGYALKILCSICSTPENPHFQELDNCLKCDLVTCDKSNGNTAIPTAYVQNLFVEDWYVVSERKNFQSVLFLLVDLGTEQMRMFFMKESQLGRKSDVGKFLIEQKEKSTTLKDVYFEGQESNVFSPDTDIDKFDMTTLLLLVRYCFNPSKGESFWENPPADDNSQLANLVRIYLYKKNVLDCSYSNRIPDEEFDNRWEDLTTLFTGVGVPVKDVEKYRNPWSRTGEIKDTDQVFLEERANFSAINSLVYDVGTQQMRSFFLSQNNVQEAEVSTFLIKERKKGRFKSVFSGQEKKMIFQQNADINKFDITIMMKLIRHCCTYPTSLNEFWVTPDESFYIKLINLIRIHQYRNKHLAHCPNSKMSVKKFDQDWCNLTDYLMKSGADYREIKKYKKLHSALSQYTV